ncbi:hypothetical protein E2C01_036610 [Portunus trituberculatus]|uniref:Uncharacterized protein n=1 Tax=Portunus trituberculatus TaxID=210409 RepID=A0A5B7FCF0_PORTR|nr:hypothetical protein [Portunus trituberculatus]
MKKSQVESRHLTYGCDGKAAPDFHYPPGHRVLPMRDHKSANHSDSSTIYDEVQSPMPLKTRPQLQWCLHSFPSEIHYGPSNGHDKIIENERINLTETSEEMDPKLR